MIENGRVWLETELFFFAFSFLSWGCWAQKRKGFQNALMRNHELMDDCSRGSYSLCVYQLLILYVRTLLPSPIHPLAGAKEPIPLDGIGYCSLALLTLAASYSVTLACFRIILDDEFISSFERVNRHWFSSLWDCSLVHTSFINNIFFIVE